MYESIPLEKSRLIEAGLPPNSTSIARAEVLQAESHSSPPSPKEETYKLVEETYKLIQKRNPTHFLKGQKKKKTEKKVLKKHTENLATLGYFLGHFKKKKK